MIDVGAYIKLIKTIRFACMYLVNQKMYTNIVIQVHFVLLLFKKVINLHLFSSTFPFQIEQ
jgi:hypothetical protein